MPTAWLMRMNEETREKKKRKEEEKKEKEEGAEEAGAGLILTYLAQQLVIFLLLTIFFQNPPHNNIFAQFFFLLSLFNTSVSFIAPNFEETALQPRILPYFSNQHHFVCGLYPSLETQQRLQKHRSLLLHLHSGP